MRSHLLFLSLVTLIGSLTLPMLAQESTSEPAKKVAATPPSKLFEAPIRLKSGDDYLGSDRLYPSPVVLDFDNDSVTELAVGDLIGQVTMTEREKISSSASWGATTKLVGTDGKDIKFSNW